jgi:flagellar motor switch protein FliM
MTDVLDQSEVDALLAAVDAGAVESASPGTTGVEIFGKSGSRGVEVALYDFKRPERVSKDQMRALEALHEGFGRNFGAAMSGFLRTIIEVSVAHIEQVTYSEFIHSLPNPTCFNLLKAEQLDGQLCLEISPLIIYPIIDRRLGGSNADLFIPQRPLTQIEQRLVQGLTTRATTHLSEAWSNLTPTTFTAMDFESNPQLVQIVPPNETVVVVGFELKMGNRAGTMSLCIPYNVIEPIMGRLAAQNWFSYQKKRGADDSYRKLSKSMGHATIETTVQLATTTIRMSDLLGMQVGDIITTEKLASSEVVFQIGDKNKFMGRVGQFRGKRAIRVTRVCKHVADESLDAASLAAASSSHPAAPQPAAAQPATKPAAAAAAKAKPGGRAA